MANYGTGQYGSGTYGNPVPAIAKDTFSRTVAAGSWGNAETGGTWEFNAYLPSHSVGDGVGRQTSSGVDQPRMAYLTGSLLNQEMLVRFRSDKLAAGSSKLVFPVLRSSGAFGATHYRLRVTMSEDQTFQLRWQVNSGSLSSLGSNVFLSRETDQVNTWFWIRAQAVGSSPTVLRGKVWRDGTPEPTSWDIITTDSTSGVQAGGGYGLRSTLSTGSTNAPVLYEWDDFEVSTAEVTAHTERAIPDSVSTSDSLAQVLGVKRSLTDTTTTTEQVVRGLGARRAPSDTTTTTDSLIFVHTPAGVAIFRAVGDTVTTTDSIARAYGVKRGLGDTTTTTDQVGRMLAARRSLGDSVPVTDTLARALGLKRTLGDSVTVSDSVARSIGWVRLLSDSVGVSDSLARRGTFGRAVGDSVGLSESLLGSTQLFRIVQDSVWIPLDTITYIADIIPPPPPPPFLPVTGDLMGNNYVAIVSAGRSIEGRVYVPVLSVDFSEGYDVVPFQRLARSVHAELVSDTSTVVNGRISVAPAAAGNGALLRSALWAPENTRVGMDELSQHTLLPASTPQELYIETNTDGALVVKSNRVVVESMTLSASFGELVQTDFQLIGVSSDRLDEYANVVTYDDAEPFSFSGASLLENNEQVASVMSFSLDVSNDVISQRSLRKSTDIKEFILTGRSIGVTLDVEPFDVHYFDSVVEKSMFHLVLDLEDGAGRRMVISLPEVRFISLDRSMSGDSESGLRVSGVAVEPRGDSIMSVTIYNEFDSLR
jgi:ribosomal protein L27